MAGLHAQEHLAAHAFTNFHGRTREGLTLLDRRGILKAGVAGVAGLSLPELLKQRAAAIERQQRISHKSVILLWMAGGPSQIDTWDPKPDRPWINRGPFGVSQTKIPGVQISEHLPKQAAMLDQFSMIRSVDCRKSGHQPNMVMQSAHREATPRTNPKGDRWPSMGSIVSKFRGANHPGMPAYVAFQKHRSHIGYAGYLGREFDPFMGNSAARLPVYDLVGKDLGKMTPGNVFQLPVHLQNGRIDDRTHLLRELDSLRRDLDISGSMSATSSYQQQAVDLLTGRMAQEAFDLEQEPASIRELYGKHLWCQQALLARRLVERGVSFVTLDLSYHSASGTWDTHGDNIPPYGGISKGLGPLLPLFDHLLTTLVGDLNSRGLLDEVLVIAMGEFGRTPNMGTQGSTDGRNHWPVVMSMCLAGGGMKHGQVIGSSTPDGGEINSRPVTPADLAATIYRHMGVPLDATYEDDRQRPHYIVQEDGQPIHELFS